MMDNVENCCGKARRKRPLGGPRCRWEDNMEMKRNRMGWYRFD